MLTVVEGSLATLIPHEPVISGAELVARVNAMAGIVVAVETQQLRDARMLMEGFASMGHPNLVEAQAQGDQMDLGEPEPQVDEEEDAVVGIDQSADRSKAEQLARQRDGSDAILWLPSGLTELERSVLHGEAERKLTGAILCRCL